MENLKLNSSVQKTRLWNMDALRGIAVLGILWVNMNSFALTSENPSPLNSSSEGINLWLWYVSSIFFEGKMRAVFSLLFGASAVLFLKNISADLIKVFFRRNLWLILFGFLHSIFIWEGDILYTYGVAALFLFSFIFASKRILVVAASIGILVCLTQWIVTKHEWNQMHEKFIIAQEIDSIGFNFIPNQNQWIEDWIDFQQEFKDARDLKEKKISDHKKNYLSQIARRWNIVKDLQPMAIYTTWLCDAFVMMLLGVLLMRLEILTGTKSKLFYAVGAFLLYSIALPINIYSALDFAQSGWLSYAQSTYSYVLYDINRLSMALAHIFFALLSFKILPRKCFFAIECVGKTAFSNYILQSVLCTLIFNGYGLGFYGTLEKWECTLVIFGVWIINICFSIFCLQFLSMGPLEWGWRCLSYWRLQPILKK